MIRLTRELCAVGLWLLTFPLVAYISTLPAQSFRNEITQWGNTATSEYKAFCDFRKQFGSNEYITVTWPGCNLDDDRIDEVTDLIRSELSDSISQVSSGREVYRELLAKSRLSQSEALKRLRNSFVGEVGNSTAIGVRLSDSGSEDRASVIESLTGVIQRCGVERDDASFAGLGYSLSMMDQEGLVSPFRMVPQIMLLAFVLTIVFVRQFWLALFINALGTYTGCLSFNFIYMSGVSMNAILWPLPTLTMLLTVSAALHFLGYIRKANQEASLAEASLAEASLAEASLATLDRVTEESTDHWGWTRGVVSMARRHALLPIFYCTLTTALGLLSLQFSSSAPVRQFGLFGALSIVAANSLLLIVLPAFVALFGIPDADASPGRRVLPKWVSWSGLSRGTHVLRWPIIVLFFAALGWMMLGVPKIRTGSDLANFFHAEHRVLLDAAVVEEAVGPLNSVELLLKFTNVNHRNDLARVQRMASFASQVVKEASFVSCVSAATFAPGWKTRPTAIQLAADHIRLKRLKKELVESGLLHIDQASGAQSWRVSCRYRSSQQNDLKQMTDRLKEMVNDQFYTNGRLVFDDERLDAVTTGEFVLFDSIDRQFFRELLLTYVVAFSVISIVVIFVLRDLQAIFIALPPNLFPAVAVLGVAGHLGFRLDVASLMTASVGLGIAVDDTLHFLMWHRAAKLKHKPKMISEKESLDLDDNISDQATDPVESALNYCGLAIMQTSLILGGSIVLYAWCGFLPTVRFGILLAAMMLAALIGDLLLLPALLPRDNR